MFLSRIIFKPYIKERFGTFGDGKDTSIEERERDHMAELSDRHQLSSLDSTWELIGLRSEIYVERNLISFSL